MLPHALRPARGRLTAEPVRQQTEPVSDTLKEPGPECHSGPAALITDGSERPGTDEDDLERRVPVRGWCGLPRVGTWVAAARRVSARRAAGWPGKRVRVPAAPSVPRAATETAVVLRCHRTVVLGCHGRRELMTTI